MRHLIEYIEDNNTSEIIEEGFFSNLFAKLGSFLVKKFGVSEDEGKKLNDAINKENEELNKEIAKITKNHAKDLISWWKLYVKQNKNAAGVTSPVEYSQAILKNTGNVAMTFGKMVDTYQQAGILNNTIICLFIKCSVNQYIAIIESILANNKKKVALAGQLQKLYNVISKIEISDNEDGEKAISDACKALDGKGRELLLKYKK